MITRTYWRLIKRFPLRPVRNDNELHVAGEILSELSMKGEKLTRDENDYLDVLERLIMDYEAKSPRIQGFLAEAKATPPQEILQSFLEDHGLSQAQLAREIGCHQENISAFLSGKRGLSKVTAMKLAKRFCVSVDLFMPRLDERIAV